MGDRKLYSVPKPRSRPLYAADAEEKSNEPSRAGAVRELGLYNAGLTNMANWQAVSQNTSSTFHSMPDIIRSRVHEYLDPVGDVDAMIRLIMGPRLDMAAGSHINNLIRADSAAHNYTSARQKKAFAPIAVRAYLKDVPTMGTRDLAEGLVDFMEESSGPFMYRNRLQVQHAPTYVLDLGNGAEVVRSAPRFNEEARLKRKQKRANRANKAIAKSKEPIPPHRQGSLEDWKEKLKDYNIIYKGGKTFARPKGG